jgi:hypothetical protein
MCGPAEFQLAPERIITCSLLLFKLLPFGHVRGSSPLYESSLLAGSALYLSVVDRYTVRIVIK